MDSELEKFSILIASNNNNAVENISKELPLYESVEDNLSGLFTKEEDVFFKGIYSGLETENWGAISAKLGNKSNINDFLSKFWFDKDTNIQNYFKKKISWQDAKINFLKKKNEVICYRKKLSAAIIDYNQMKSEKSKLDVLIEKYKEANKKKIEIEMKNEKLEKDIEVITKKIESVREMMDAIKNNIPWYKKMLKFLFLKDFDIVNLEKTHKALIQSMEQKIQFEDDLNLNSLELDQVKDKVKKIDEEKNIQQSIFDKYKRLYLENKSILGENFIEEEFWIDIGTNESSQVKCPWTNNAYDKLREELFYYSLKLHVAFFTNSKELQNNMNAVNQAWSGGLSKQDKEAYFNDIFQSLFLIVPVISTTFASVSNFLQNISKEQIGMLIIDEAGQATPQSSIGAIYRSKKVIVVGDPIQVEPILTVPNEIITNLSKKYNLPYSYEIREFSTQAMADAFNNVGTFRSNGSVKCWVGCPLVIHRRCSDPMFTIANKIAYNNGMFNKSIFKNDDYPFMIEKSKWIDIKGKARGQKNHYINEQGDYIIDMLNEYIKKYNKLPDIYIISPFKTVIETLKKAMAGVVFPPNIDPKKWLKSNVGTVHTFQGKEAKEVIILLGCDTASGLGAAAWVGMKPNILNVAITRAKQRVVFIGEKELWSKINYFDTIIEELDN